MSIKNTKSDAVEAESSVAFIEDTRIEQISKNGLHFSRSLLHANNVSIEKAENNAVSLGKLSRAFIRNSKLSENEVGINVKSHSNLSIESSVLSKNKADVVSDKNDQ